MRKKEVDDILKKYKKKLKETSVDDGAFSIQYAKFKKEMRGEELTLYEKFCNLSERILKVSTKPDKREKLVESIDRIGLNITPEGAVSFATLFGFAFILLGFIFVIVGYVFFTEPYFSLVGEETFMKALGTGPIFFFIFFVIFGLVSMRFLTGVPNRKAVLWRIKASDQMVLCVLYMVMYMRHTSNLEHAVKFAAQHLDDPLASDLKRVFWNLETGKAKTVAESLDIYLEGWREHNMEFVNSIHLIESSLYEPSEKRRLEILDRGLDTILNGTYERMMHYAHEVRVPITNLYMLGIILPILALIMLPLMGAFLGVKWYWLAFLYNILLPVFVYFRGNEILSKRPGGSSESSLLKRGGYEKYKKISFFGLEINPIILGVPILILILIIGLSPLILHSLFPGNEFLNGDGMFGYFDDNGICAGKDCLGPYGTGALYFSLLIPLSWTFGIGTYYKLKTKKLIKIKDGVVKLEKEFSGSLFQLGNRIGDGLPAEIAVEKVAENMRGTPTGEFFRIISINIRKLGMDLSNAIFNRERGGIVYYPSNLIQSSMRVLVQSVQKGPKIASSAMISISNYLININKINERLKDLLSEVISSMKAQINFLTPLIAGIVVGIGAMITGIIVKLGPLLKLTGGESVEGFGVDLSIIAQIFPIDKVIPPYFFQLVVGVYILQLVIILTKLRNGIEFGVDKLREDSAMGGNLFKGVGLYVVVSVIVIIVLSFLSRGVLGAVGGF